MRGNEDLKSINIPNVKYIDKDFLISNAALQELEIPNIETIENGFLMHNDTLIKINIPKVKRIGDWFLNHNTRIKACDIHAPQLESISIYKTLRENLDIIPERSCRLIDELVTKTEAHNKGKNKNKKQKKKLRK